MIDAKQIEEALPVLQALVRGVDPQTKEPLPKNSVVHAPGVIRALLTGVEVLQGTQARIQRRAAVPTNCGQSWSEREDEQLRAEFQSNMSMRDIAAKHQRTVTAIESRLEKLGLITAEQRKTQNRFIPLQGDRRPRGRRGKS